jgi:hypothetical protein
MHLITGKIITKGWSLDIPSVNNSNLFSYGIPCFVSCGSSNAMNLNQFQCGLIESETPFLKDFLPNLNIMGRNEIEQIGCNKR